MQKYGREFAQKVAARLKEDELFWRGGGMGARSDGLTYDPKTSTFTYGVIEEATLLSPIETFATESEFIAWLETQSDPSMNERVAHVGPTSVTRLALETFIASPSNREITLAMYDTEQFGLDLSTQAVKALSREDFRAPSKVQPISDGFTKYAYVRFENGKAVETFKAFTDETTFIEWLSDQSDRSMIELAMKHGMTWTTINRLRLLEFATQ